MSLHITSLTYMQYILIKLIQHHAPCFIPKHRGMELLVTKWIWFNRKIRRRNLRGNFLTKWKNWPDDDDGADVEMEQTTCGKMETSRRFCLGSVCNYLSFDNERQNISSTSTTRKLLYESGWRRRSQTSWRTFNWVMVPKSCSMVSHDSVAVWGRQWSYLQGDVVKKKKAGKSTRLCQTPKCSSFSCLITMAHTLVMALVSHPSA